METLTFKCKILTPMFLGGANPADAELRAASVKGALRFWWRATKGDKPLQTLKVEEVKLFGGVVGEHKCRSRISIEVEGDVQSSTTPFSPNPKLQRRIRKGTSNPLNAQVPLLEYLAFGAVDRGEYHAYLPAGEDFQIHIGIQNNVISESELKKLMLVWSIFGGLGSRSRNGYGRFEVEGLNSSDINEVIKTYSTGNLANYTAFSKNSSLFKLNDAPNSPCTDWNNLLFKLGKSYLGARVNYHNGTSFTSAGLEDERRWIKRPYIAAPLLANNRQQPLKYFGGQIDLDRHAKTHFFGITKENATYKGYILHLPHKFLESSTGELKGVNTTNLSLLQTEYGKATSAFNSKLLLNSMTQILP